MDGHIGTNVKREGVGDGDAGQEICRSHRKRHARVRLALGTKKSLFVWSCSDHQAVFQMVTFHPGRCFMLPPMSDSTGMVEIQDGHRDSHEGTWKPSTPANWWAATAALVVDSSPSKLCNATKILSVTAVCLALIIERQPDESGRAPQNPNPQGKRRRGNFMKLLVLEINAQHSAETPPQSFIVSITESSDKVRSDQHAGNGLPSMTRNEGGGPTQTADQALLGSCQAATWWSWRRSCNWVAMKSACTNGVPKILMPCSRVGKPDPFHTRTSGPSTLFLDVPFQFRT